MSPRFKREVDPRWEVASPPPAQHPQQQAFACERPFHVVYTGEMEKIGEGAYVTLWRKDDGREYLRVERRGEYYWYRLEEVKE